MAFCLALAPFGSPPVARAAFGWTQEEMYPQILPPEYIASLAEAEMERVLAAQGETRRHTLKLTRKPQEMRCPAGKMVCETEIPKAIHYGGLTPVYVKVYVDGALFRRTICYYELHVYGNMLVAAHDLRLNRTLTEADVRLQEHEVESPADRYLEDPKRVVGKVPSRVILTGRPVTEDMLQNPVVIDVGSPVRIVSRQGGIHVSTDGLAMQKGRVGSIIRVKNAHSGKVMRARVVDATTVELL